MYRRANKVLDMRPDEFWGLTPWECGVLIEGAAGREEREWERAALIATCAMNPHLKKPITPAQLLGRKDPVTVRDPGAEAEALRSRLLEFTEQEES